MSALQSIGNRLALLRPADRVKPEDQLALASNLQGIVAPVFQPLITWQTNQEKANTPPEATRLLEDSLLNQDYWPLFALQIVERLSTRQDKGLDPAAALLDYYRRQPTLGRPALRAFCDLIRTVFTRTSVPTPAQQKRARQFHEGLAVIARAIQEVVLWVPGRFLSADASAPPEFVKLLEQSLEHIERIRKQWDLPEPALRADRAKSLLKRNVALAQKALWIPFNPLVTAPLAGDDLCTLYARDLEPARLLAREIVRSDGVILITGYRGVGKSSFINQALRLAREEIEPQQTATEDSAPWKTVPVAISIAKSREVYSILRLCLRRLFEALTRPDLLPNLLEEELRQLQLAYLRATYDVNIQRSMTELRSRDVGISLAVKPSEWLPAEAGGRALSVLPAIGYQVARALTDKIDRSVGLPKYDSDQAEDDVTRLIGLLARPRRGAKGQLLRLRLVFVFDEMDKLDAVSEQDPLVKQLKSLFLTRNAVFLLVTSKDFYYQWQRARRSEDAVLGSFFSAVHNVPLFTTVDTETLLQNLTPKGDEQIVAQFRTLLARYLTYQAVGLPREIVRTLQARLQWEGLQLYLTGTPTQKAEMEIYASIQQALERQDIADRRDLAYLLLDEASWEQVQRVRYALVETSLHSQAGLELNNLEPIQKNYAANLPLDDLRRLTTRLVETLAKLTVGQSNAPLFRCNDNVLQVDDVFYMVSRHEPEPVPIETAAEAAAASVNAEEVIGLMRSGKPFDIQKAIKLARQAAAIKSLPPAVCQSLYVYFITPSDRLFRLEAGNLLSGEAFYEAAQRDRPDTFLSGEGDEALLMRFLHLLQEATQEHPERKEQGAEWALTLLTRSEGQSAQGGKGAPRAAAIPSQVQVLALALLADLTEQDVFKSIMGSLDWPASVSGELMEALLKLAKRTQHSRTEVLSLLAERHQKIDDSAAPAFIDWQRPKEMAEMWGYLMDLKPSEGVLRKLSLNLLQSVLGDSQTKARPLISRWLNSTSWSEYDQALLVEAGRGDKRLIGLLQQLISPPSVHLTEAAQQIEAHTIKAEKAPAPAAASAPSSPWSVVISILLGIALWVVYVSLPYDLPAGVTLTSRILGRILETIYPLLALSAFSTLGGGALLCFDKDERGTACGLLVATAVLVPLAAGAVALIIFSLHHPLSWKGQFSLWVAELMVIVVPWVTKALIDWWTWKKSKPGHEEREASGTS